MMTDSSIGKEKFTDARNNIVAESELRGALEAIENRLESVKANDSWKEGAGENDLHEESAIADGENNESDGDLCAETKESLHSLIDQAKRSLPDHIRRVVQPLSDAEFHEYARRNETPLMEDEQLDDDDEETSESECEIPEEEYDEEELVDQNAVQRARLLRKQVREAASRVQILRDSATSRAIAIAEGEVKLMQDGIESKTVQLFDPEDYELNLRAPIEDSSIEKIARLEEMEKSLSTLMSSLEQMDSKLPESMDTLQGTIDTIQESLSKQNPQSMSQIERAITSRDNEGSEEVVLTSDYQSNMPADKRLASFLSKY